MIIFFTDDLRAALRRGQVRYDIPFVIILPGYDISDCRRPESLQIYGDGVMRSHEFLPLRLGGEGHAF